MIGEKPHLPHKNNKYRVIMKGIEYPRYTRRQRLNCKLSEKDIIKIKSMRGQGARVGALSKKFKVSEYAIWYWLKSDEERSQFNKKQYLSYGIKRDRSDKQKRQRKSHNRKYKIMPTFREYVMHHNIKWRLKQK